MSTSASTVALALLDAVDDAILVIDSTLQLTYMNESTRTVLGLGTPIDPDAPIDPLQAVHPDDLVGMLAALDEVMSGRRQKHSYRFRVRHHEGASGWKPVDATATNHLTTPGIHGVVVTFRDLEEYLSHVQLASSLTEALENTGDYVAIHRSDGRVLYANAALRSALGWQAGPPSGDGWPHYGPLDEILADQILPQLAVSGAWAGEVQVRQPDGDTVLLAVTATGRPGDAAPGAANSLVVFAGRDISSQRRIEADLQYRELHDPVTRMPNRQNIEQYLRTLLSEPSQQHTLAVLNLELDGFKAVIEGLGHAHGDALLQEVSARFRQVIRPGDLFARVGTDDFALAIYSAPADEPIERAKLVASRLHSVLRPPFDVDGSDVYLHAAIGLAAAAEGDSESDLLRKARLAAHAAAESGRGSERVEVFRAAFAQRAERRLRIESGLNEAIGSRGLGVVYQPIVDLATGNPKGFEALVRWHRDGQVVAPAEFLDVAERANLITYIDTYVLREACRQLAEWDLHPSTSVATMSVNMSAPQLLRPDLVGVLVECLGEAGVAPSRLTLEITENGLYTDMSQALDALDGLRGVGVQLAIDDFGTGYSSLSHLRQFKVDSVKIDRSFMTDVADRQIVEAVVGMASSLGMSTVAEGVEHSSQVDYLKSIDCTYAQGYLFAKPLDADQAGQFLVSAGH